MSAQCWFVSQHCDGTDFFFSYSVRPIWIYGFSIPMQAKERFIVLLCLLGFLLIRLSRYLGFLFNPYCSDSEHTAPDDVVASSGSGDGKRQHFWIGRWKVVVAVLTVTFLMSPSAPGWVSMTLASGHWAGAASVLGFIRTRSPTLRLGWWLVHLECVSMVFSR